MILLEKDPQQNIVVAVGRKNPVQSKEYLQ